MKELEIIREMVQAARSWRDRALDRNNQEGLTDLSYRPESGMSSLGWLLAHQGAVYDFSLNALILKRPPSNNSLFRNHLPGTDGAWDGTPLTDIMEYYDSTELEFVNWLESATDEDMDRVVEGTGIPPFFQGMTVRRVISFMFTHLNHHNGHLDALRRDWQRRNAPPSE